MSSQHTPPGADRQVTTLHIVTILLIVTAGGRHDGCRSGAGACRPGAADGRPRGAELFGWFGGYGLAAVSGFFEGLGFRPGRLFATAAALAETAGGLLVALGLLGPIGPALVLAVMIVAAVSVHWGNGLFATSNGIEVPLLYATGAAALALTGPGRYSLDALLGLTALWTPALAWSALAAAVAGGAANLALRRPAPEAAAAA